MKEDSLLPYISYSLKLKAKPRRGGGNMFRHQMETLAILLEYGYNDAVLLKAALIHDLIEDSERIGFHALDSIPKIDTDGTEVFALVKEVSQIVINGVKEPKDEFLLRIMTQCSENAHILKLADRISNLSALPNAGDNEFITKYIAETEQYILPYADKINKEMASEMKERIHNIKNLIVWKS